MKVKDKILESTKKPVLFMCPEELDNLANTEAHKREISKSQLFRDALVNEIERG